MVCQHHEKHLCMKRLNVHPPRKPHNILSAVQPDQLCPCQIQARTVQPLKVGKDNTNLGMRLQNISYAGADSFTITAEPQVSTQSRILLSHEALSIAQRKDIKHYYQVLLQMVWLLRNLLQICGSTQVRITPKEVCQSIRNSPHTPPSGIACSFRCASQGT
jgi:hypothetical protein